MKSIFVSSTFRDMQAERDMLALKVIPELNDYAREFKESIRFVDLRWGINNENEPENEASTKVLTVCLDEIDNTRPYMIILIGERYGWIPPENLMERAINEKEYKTSDLNKSVTELEIEYGAFCNKAMLDRCLFYFREPLNIPKSTDKSVVENYVDQDENYQYKLKALKEKIITSGAKVSYYRCEWSDSGLKVPEEFISQVIDDVKNAFHKEFEITKNLDWQEKEHMVSQLYIEQKSMEFFARYDLLNKYITDINTSGKQLFILQGEAGSGKSTMMAKIASELNNQHLVFFTASGLSQNAQSISEVLKQHIYYFERVLNIEEQLEDYVINEDRVEKEDVIDQLVDKVEELSSKYCEKVNEPIYIMVDALEQLSSHSYVNQFKWLSSKLPNQIKIIVSCSEEFEIPSMYPMSDKAHHWQLMRLKHEEKPQIIHGILKSVRKELSNDVITLVTETQSSNNPLYLSLMLQRLIMLNSKDFQEMTKFSSGITGIHQYMMHLIKNSPRTTDLLSVELFKEAGSRINIELCNKVCAFIALSRRGLRESDLEVLLYKANSNWNTLDFSRFIKYLHPYFLKRSDGRIDFSYKSIREGILKREFLSTIGNTNRLGYRQHLNHLIFEHLQTLHDLDEIKIHEFLYHAYYSNDKENALNYILKICKDEQGKNKKQDRKEYLSILSLNLSNIGIEDSVWLYELFVLLKSEETTLDFIDFVVYYFIDQYLYASSNIENSIAIGIVLERAIGRSLEVRKNADSYKSYSLVLWKLGEMYELSKNSKMALEVYLKDVEINKQICELNTVYKKTDVKKYYLAINGLGESYDKLAAFYGKQENDEEVIKWSKLCYETYGEYKENIVVAKCYDRIAKAYKRLGKIEEALNISLKATPLIEAILDNKPKIDYVNALRINSTLLGSLYKEMDKQNSEFEKMGEFNQNYHEKAIEYFNKAANCAVYVVDESGDVVDYIIYCESLIDLSDIYYYVKDINKSYESANRAVNIAKQVFDSELTTTSVKLYIKALNSKLRAYDLVKKLEYGMNTYVDYSMTYKDLSKLYYLNKDYANTFQYLNKNHMMCLENYNKVSDE